jgi:ABC-type sugar transport system permease subunit
MLPARRKARGKLIKRGRQMAVAVAKRRRTRGLGGERAREALVGYGFIALPMAFFLLFFIVPVGYAIYISRYDWQIFKGPFVGWGNYRKLYHDTVFWHHAVRNTLVYTAFVVPLQIALGLTLAVVVNQAIRFRTFFRAAFYFPSLAASAAIAAIATYILASDGLFNTVLNHLGYHHNTAWFGEQSTALPSIIGLNAWTTSGTMMLFYLAALQSIPTDVYEAAAIDGAGAWRTFRKVTFPLLKPAHFFVLVVSIIGSLQMFDQAFLIGGASGGPNYSTMTVVLYLYNQSIKNISFGYGAAIGVVLFVFLFTVTVIQRLLFGKPEVA